MSMNNIVKELRERVEECSNPNYGMEMHLLAKLMDRAADTIEYLIEYLSVMLEAIDKTERYCKKYCNRWRPISEYSMEEYDWVLVKYFDGDFECVPQVAELRQDGKWHVSTSFDEDYTIPSQFEVRYFFDMKNIKES